MRNRKGLSLIEVFIGIAVAIIASLVSLQFLIHCERLAVEPRLKLIALNFARETIEELYLKGFDDLPSTTSTPVITTPNISEEPYVSNPDLKLLFERYHGARSYTVVEKNGTNSSHACKVIKVTVSWSWS